MYCDFAIMEYSKLNVNILEAWQNRTQSRFLRHRLVSSLVLFGQVKTVECFTFCWFYRMFSSDQVATLNCPFLDIEMFFISSCLMTFRFFIQFVIYTLPSRDEIATGSQTRQGNSPWSSLCHVLFVISCSRPMGYYVRLLFHVKQLL